MIGPSEVAVLVRAGVLRPARPDRVARQLIRLRQYGPTLAGGYAVAAARAPHRLALADETTAHTFAQTDARVRALAAGLVRRGAGSGTSVALLGHNSVDYAEALIATSRTGADALLLSTFLSATQLAALLAAQRPVLVIADEVLLPLLAEVHDGPPVVLMSDLDALALPVAAQAIPRPSEPGRLVVLTSGTTGVPKGARRRTPAGLGPAASLLDRLRLQAYDRIMVSSPLFHTWGLAMLQIAPALAAGVVVRRRADVAVVLDAVAAERCTVLAAVPAVLDRIARMPAAERARHDVSSLRVVASSGSALTAEASQRARSVFGDVIYNVYGSTENSWATIADPADLAAVPGTAGRPPRGTVVAILDEGGARVPPQVVGRIFVGNDLPFEGYTDGSNRPVQDGLMATGDLGYLDPEGRLMVVGRADDLVISGAEKVYPLEVEQVICTLSGVRETAVVGRPDPDLGQRLVAFVACEPEAGVTAEAVQEHVRERLARFAVPKEVVFVEALPRTPTGKVVRRLLPVE